MDTALSILSQVMPEEGIIFFVSMLPVVELRGAIPLAMGAFGFSPWKAAVFAVVGNMVPVIVVLWLLRVGAHAAMERIPGARRVLEWVFERTRTRARRSIEAYGALGLVVLVAIPLPMTGAWTGTVAAWLFDIPYRKAVGLIAVGVVIAACIVTIASMGVIPLFSDI